LLSSSDCAPDVICLQELWQFPVYANFTLPGYNSLEYKLRNPNTQGGGVGIYIKKSIKYNVLSAQSVFVDRIFESIFIQLNLSNTKKCIVGSVYRPGTAHPTLTAGDAFTNFSELLSNVLDELSSYNMPIYLLGDLNLDVLQIDSSNTVSDYINLLFSYGLLQVITKPTRCTDHSATIIDHVITNTILTNYNSYIITSGVSDHFPVVFFPQEPKPHVAKKAVYSRDFSEPNLLKFEQSLHSIRWGFVLEEEDPQIAYNLFSDLFFNLYNLHFPLREIKFNKNLHKKEPWMSKGLLISRNEKMRLASLAAKNPTPLLKSDYKNYRNIYNSLLRAGKRLYYERELGKNVSNLKKTWELIKKATNTGCSSSDSITKLVYNGETFLDSFNIACKLNEFFTSMPLKIASEIPPCEDDIVESTDDGSSLDENTTTLLNFTSCPVTESEILDAITMLLPKKTEDFNGISMFFVKKFKNYLVKPLNHIFNCSFLSSVVPSQFKIAKVIPLFKSGDKLSPDNYRPISLLSCFSKIFEKVVCLRLLNFLENNDILSPDQFGFRKSHSAGHPMVHLMNFVSKALNKKETAIAIFCDLRKAFDTVNHEILL